MLSAQQQELSLFEHGVGVDFTFSGGGAFNFPHVEKQNSRRVKISLTKYEKHRQTNLMFAAVLLLLIQ